MDALLEAFELVEAVQGEHAEDALARVAEARQRSGADADVRFLLDVATAIHAVLHGDDEAELLLARLHTSAPDDACVATALGLSALLSATRGDSGALIRDAATAVALLDDRRLPGAQRCLALVVVAAALNTLRVWEVVDDLYQAALEDEVAAAAARQAAAVAVNRVLIGLEHGLGLLECGDPSSYERLAAARDLVPAALRHDLIPLMRHDVEAAADLVRLLHGEDVDVSRHVEALTAVGDVEVLPLLLAAVALQAWRVEGDTDPAVALETGLSATSGARTFPLWVRAQVLEGRSAYADHVARQHWEARLVVVSAVRAQIEAERRRAEHERLTRAVNTDPLTGLLNRRRFDDWLRRPGGGPTALVLLDLDGFKTVNDVFGHAAGDAVLRRVGLLLRAAVRPGDLAVRQGGDEFAIVLQHADLDAAAVLARAQELSDAVRDEPWDEVAVGLRLGVSIGAALSTDCTDGAALYEAADAALYSAKRDRLPPVLAEPLSR